MNIGSAVKSQLLEAPQNEVARTAPGGVEIFKTIAVRPVRASANAIQMPEPRMANRKPNNMAERTSRSNSLLPGGDRVLGGLEGGHSAPPNHEPFVEQRDQQEQQSDRHCRLGDRKRNRQ